MMASSQEQRRQAVEANPRKHTLMTQPSSQISAQAKENEALSKKVEDLKNALDDERAERAYMMTQQLEEAKQSMRDEFMYLYSNLPSKQVYMPSKQSIRTSVSESYTVICFALLIFYFCLMMINRSTCLVQNLMYEILLLSFSSKEG